MHWMHLLDASKIHGRILLFQKMMPLTSNLTEPMEKIWALQIADNTNMKSMYRRIAYSFTATTVSICNFIRCQLENPKFMIAKTFWMDLEFHLLTLSHNNYSGFISKRLILPTYKHGTNHIHCSTSIYSMQFASTSLLL